MDEVPDTIVIAEPGMKTILAGLVLSAATVANGQTSVLRGATPDQLFGVLGGPPREWHTRPKRVNVSLVEQLLGRVCQVVEKCERVIVEHVIAACLTPPA
jgi:hypothetical protein